MILGRSVGVLSSMIIMNCNAIGGESLAKTVSAVGTSRVKLTNVSSVNRTLRKGTTNLCIHRGDTRPNKKLSVLMHKTNSVGTGGSPLCVMSKFPVTGLSRVTSSSHGVSPKARNMLGFLGPGSMRSVRMLGSTDTASVCNTHTTGNMMVVAAGHKGRKGAGIDCSCGCSCRGCSSACSLLSLPR